MKHISRILLATATLLAPLAMRAVEQTGAIGDSAEKIPGILALSLNGRKRNHLISETVIVFNSQFAPIARCAGWNRFLDVNVRKSGGRRTPKRNPMTTIDQIKSLMKSGDVAGAATTNDVAPMAETIEQPLQPESETP